MDIDNFVLKAMPALLADTDTKRAILDYLKAITDKARPQEDWREVWHFQSTEIRVLDEIDPVTAVKGVRTQLFMVGRHHAGERAGIIEAYIDSPHHWSNHQWFDHHRAFGYRRPDTSILRETITALDYTAVILKAQSLWDTAQQTWLNKTVELNDTTS